MTVRVALIAAGLAALLLVAGAIGSRRRGIGRWSLIPWDHLLLLGAIGLMAALAQAAIAWRTLP